MTVLTTNEGMRKESRQKTLSKARARDEVEKEYKESPRRFQAIGEDRKRKERLKDERMAEAKQIVDKIVRGRLCCSPSQLPLYYNSFALMRLSF